MKNITPRRGVFDVVRKAYSYARGIWDRHVQAAQATRANHTGYFHRMTIIPQQGGDEIIAHDIRWGAAQPVHITDGHRFDLTGCVYTCAFKDGKPSILKSDGVIATNQHPNGQQIILSQQAARAFVEEHKAALREQGFNPVTAAHLRAHGIRVPRRIRGITLL